MLRFTEQLLSVACTLPLFFVNGFQALQPSIKDNSLRAEAVIRGLLVPRQFFCQPGFNLCQSTFCCPKNWNCCKNGSCCQPSFYCAVGSNGDFGCCPDGKICSGPAPVNNPSPPPPAHPSPKPPPKTNTHPHSSSPSSKHPLSTTTFTTLLGSPTSSPQNKIIDVSVVDADINWSGNWVLRTSSCDRSIQSKITSTVNSSFTYMTKDIDPMTSLGYFYYINVVNYNTEWEVLLDGVLQTTYFSNSSDFTNCTYVKSSNMIHTQVNFSQNITVVAHGPEIKTLNRLSTPSNPWSLEVNMLLIQEINSLSGSASTMSSTNSSSSAQNTAASTTVTQTSAAGRMQPLSMLPVVTASGSSSIVLAAVISILVLRF